MNELSSQRHVCPKCGKPYTWMMTKEFKYQLVVFHFRCLDCGTTDNFALSEREFYDFLWNMETGGKVVPDSRDGWRCENERT